MRTRTAAGSQVSVSLFPFLAVLICTMGVLLLLLVIAVHVADQSEAAARSAAEAPLTSALDDLRSEVALTELKTSAVLESRQLLQRELEQARARRGHIESELGELEKRFVDLQRQFRDAANPQGLDAQHLAADATRIAAEIQQATATLEELQRQSQGRPKMYSIVPHRSIHGTLRRPIYLECLEDRIVFRPGDVAIPAAELEPPILPGNPLDVALQAIRTYWLKLKLAGENGSPYPLLVVRPGGSRTYALARRAMQNWDDEFGYELVEQDKLLDFGEPDPTLVSHVRQTLQTARAQYAVLREMAQAQQARAESMQAAAAPGGLQASPQGGFVISGSRQPAGQMRSKSGADLSERSSQNPVSGDSPEAFRSGASGARERNTPLGDSADDDSTETNVARGAAQRAGDPLTGEGERSPPRDATPVGTAAQSGSAGTPAPAKSLLTGVAPYALAESRGANWAVPAYQPNATAYRRLVTIECTARGLLLEPAVAGGSPQAIAYDQDLVGTTDQLVDALWHRIKGWGIAERNGYWLPELRFVVHPEGRAAFAQLRGLLANSGLELTEAAR